jgi:hypothetical protein
VGLQLRCVDHYLVQQLSRLDWIACDPHTVGMVCSGIEGSTPLSVVCGL